MSKVGDRCSGRAREVEAAVIVKALIFDSQDGVDEVWRHTRERCVHPLLFEDAEHQLIVVIVDGSRLVHLPDPRDGGLIRQSLLKIDEIPDWPDDRERRDDPETDE